MGWIILCSDALEDGGYEVADAALVVGVGFGVEAVGNDGADGHAAVAHEFAEALEGRALHLVVGDATAFVLEGFDAGV